MPVRYAPDIDLVLLSHGDLAHSGLYAYAYCHWDLRAPCYTTLPVQATARIATMEDVEGIRDEQEVDIIEEENNESVDAEDAEGMESRSPKLKNEPKKFVATVQEVHEAFDAVNTLRYSQPTHLQGKSLPPSIMNETLKFSTCRKVSRPDHYAILSWAHAGWNNMEDKIAFRRNHCICRELESHARAAYRWHSPLPSCSRWCLRTTCPTGSLYHRC